MFSFVVVFLCFSLHCFRLTKGYTINQAHSRPKAEMKAPGGPTESDSVSVSFSHIQLFVDKVEDLQVYKQLEEQLNSYCTEFSLRQGHLSFEEKRMLWKSLLPQEDANEIPFSPQNRDVVKQLLVGLGFRVSGSYYDTSTRSVLVTSREAEGVQILVSAAIGGVPSRLSASPTGIFDKSKIDRFMKSHDGRQGIGVLAFSVKNVKTVHDSYLHHHPALIDSYVELPEYNLAVLEVFAYYKHKNDGEHCELPSRTRIADEGTILRFVDFCLIPDGSTQTSLSCVRLGMTACPAVFDDSSMPAFCDHWVSNVFDRTEFLNTLHDTLGFTPKVDFNAGVVAAGEAQIESTVTGNTLKEISLESKLALRDQSQVFLPINNALSSVGHVHGFLREIGQGVQHIASRVSNLVDFVQRCNDFREITGEGFVFLNIPRSYYGTLSPRQLIDDMEGALSASCAEAVVDCLEQSMLVSKDGAVDLYLEKTKVALALDSHRSLATLDDYLKNKDGIVSAVLKSRYRNLHKLLGEQVSEENYLAIVRNQILVDIQGGDLLYQIFTSNILQRNAGEEAPFIEYIQRVCSKDVVKPGCGGFGIRNFLTLFLSIEVSKAMQDVIDARALGDLERQQYAQKMVEYFTEQMNESNPILTDISDAMTDEGVCKDKIAELSNNHLYDEVHLWEVRLQAATDRKIKGNSRLMECSSRYNELMKQLRKSRETVK